MTIPQLRKAFDHVEEFTNSLLKSVKDTNETKLSSPRFGISDLSQINNNHPTCKTVMNNKKIECDETCTREKSCNSCYDVKSKKGVRIPSYCDRVLAWSNVGQFVDFTTSTLNAKDFPFIKFSDHNPIISSIRLPIPNDYFYDNNDNEEDTLIGGGIIFMNKLTKYKQKYTYLLNKYYI